MRRTMTLAAMLGAVCAFGGSAAAQNLVPCAPEHGYCSVPYPTTVVFGVPGRSVSRDVGGRGIPCSNSVFGDPAPGVVKRCAYIARGRDRGEERVERPRLVEPRDRDRDRDGYRDGAVGRRGDGWRPCAPEGGFCDFRGTRLVRYGVGSRFTERRAHNGIPCTNRAFGDPAPLEVKTCEIRVD